MKNKYVMSDQHTNHGGGATAANHNESDMTFFEARA